MMLISRRGFLLAGAGLLAGPAAWAQQGQEPALGSQGEEGSLRDPEAAGRSLEPSTARDNDESVKQVEHRMKCTCGCNLDIYTCRTTDFTCSTSPRLHHEVLALQDQGKSEQQVIDAFVAKYGEQILMAPKVQGFNIAGYVVPGIALLIAGATLTFVLRRRMRLSPASAPSIDASPGHLAQGHATHSHEELERLHRELSDLERQ